MPVCTFTTSISYEDMPDNFHVELAEEVARVLSKPIERVTVMLHPDTIMFRNGSTSPAAILTIWSINVFSAETNPGFARSLKNFITAKLNLPEDRLGILFHDLQPTQLGWPVH